MSRSVTGLVLVQFNLTSPRLLPRALRPFEKEAETSTESSERRDRNLNGNGKKLLDTTEPVDGSKLISGLQKAGLVLVSGFWQDRVDRHDPGIKYVTVRVELAREVYPDAHQPFIEASRDILAGVRGLLYYNLWGTRLYRNPYFHQGRMVEGMHMYAFNFGWRRDRNNSTPKHCLWIKRQEIGVDEVEV